MDYRAVFAALQLAALLCCANSQLVDLTLAPNAKGKSVVRSTVRKIAESGIFPDDVQSLQEFLMRMAFAETNNGKNATPGDGGIWAVSEDTLRVTTRFVSSSLEQGKILGKKISSAFGFDWSTTVLVNDCNNVNVICDRQKMDVPLYSALAVMIRLNITNEMIPEDKDSQVTLWKEVFSYTEEKINRSNDYVQECAIKGVDMIFVMDESYSIKSSNFELMKELAINITREFAIGPDRTQVGWINFNESARVVFNLSTYQDKTSLQEGIREVEYLNGMTNIGASLLALHDQGFTPDAGARNTFDISEVAIVVTDGISDPIPIQEAAKMLNDNRSVDVFVVGVGDEIEREQLEAVAEAGIASNISRNIFILSSFAHSELNSLQETLRARICFDATFSGMLTPEEISIKNISGTIPEGAMAHINTECPPEGLTINACAKEGIVVLFISKTPNPSQTNHDKAIFIEKGKCDNTYIECPSGRRRRQISDERIYIGIEGVEEANEYELDATIGDTSTPNVRLHCQRDIETNPNKTLIVTCVSERTLTEVLCSVNDAPFEPCTLPWRVDISSPTIREYHLQINVTDSLNLTDSDIIDYEVGPLVLRCSFNAELEIECLSNNQLAPNATVCSFNGVTTNPCILSHGIDVTGLPAGVYSGLVEATDTFGSSASSTIEYQVVEDRVSDDMVMTVPLDINPLQIGVSANSLSLCYQVHGEEDKFYNLLSDDCVSVNAHVSQPYTDRHIIDKIGIRAVGNNGTCYDISIERENCAVSINNQSLPTNNHFQEEGIEVLSESLTEIPTIHVSVPNCGKPTIDYMFISCTQYTIRDTPTDILQFGSTRGKSQVQPPHGLIGQFWGAFMFVQNHIADPLTSRLPANRKHYDITVFPPSFTSNVNLKPFVSTLIPRGWGSQQTPCLYAGDRQGGPVIQGKYSDYEVNGLFGTQYLFSKFDESKC